MDFKDIVDKGLATTKGKNYIVKVTENDRGKMKIGDHSLVFQFITPPPPAHLRYPTKLKVNLWDMIYPQDEKEKRPPQKPTNAFTPTADGEVPQLCPMQLGKEKC